MSPCRRRLVSFTFNRYNNSQNKKNMFCFKQEKCHIKGAGHGKPNAYVQKKKRCTLATIKVHIPLTCRLKYADSATHPCSSLTQGGRRFQAARHTPCMSPTFVFTVGERTHSTFVATLDPPSGCADMTATTAAQHLDTAHARVPRCACSSTLPQIPDRSIFYIPRIRSSGRNQNMHFFVGKPPPAVPVPPRTSAPPPPSSASSKPSALTKI